MKNIALTIAYDGTRYLGWQKTNIGPSIEQTLQAVLEKALQHPVVLQAASRTDSGVHANGQVVNFFSSNPCLDLYKLLASLNRLLPKDIIVREVIHKEVHFHPTLDCAGKEYHYFICYGPTQLPCQRLYSWHVPYMLNLDSMNRAASYIIGEHDFKTFCNRKRTHRYSHYIRTVDAIEITEIGEMRLCIKVRGNHFLYKMVRNIAGTIAQVGYGRIEENAIKEMLESQDRVFAGMTAPAHGLFLDKVFYHNSFSTIDLLRN